MPRAVLRASITLAVVALTACGSGGGNGGGSPTPAPVPVPAPPPPPTPPAPPTAPAASPSQRTDYNGITDDLLTAGLGWDGLLGAAPAVSNPPTAAELRRLAIYNNYRALVDMTEAGGYSTLFGPNVALNGSVDTSAGAGKIAGSEYLVLVPGSSGFAQATLMVQVPDSFNPATPCIVTATSSGSRGVYGAISAAGEWALKRGCAVAYTDKGSGNGAHELSTNTVTLMRGLTATAAAAGSDSVFTAPFATDQQRIDFLAQFPNRYAYKHAHSQINPEAWWGAFTLTAVQYAFNVLNLHFAPQQFTTANTIVIADSVSNGAGAALAAAEQDNAGLIDGVVATEPQMSLFRPERVLLVRGATVYSPFSVGRPLYDYTTVANLLQPCAAFAVSNTDSPLRALIPTQNAQARCTALVAAGYITGADFQTQANNALSALRLAGWEPESDLLHASHWGLQATPGVAVTYANAYARASVRDNLCGFSFATTSAVGEPAAPAVSPMATIFGVGNGVPPTGGINLIYNPAAGGAIAHTIANGDFAFAGAHCLRQLWETSTPAAQTVKQGIDEIRLTGNLRGKPAIIVHGRADALVPVNHTSRPYFGLNRIAEGANARLSYIEVTNAQHFEAFLGLAGYNNRFIPLHYYSIQALNTMWSHLTQGTALPPSQVVRTTPRGTGAPPIVAATHLPAISAAPPVGDRITFAIDTVIVPN